MRSCLLKKYVESFKNFLRYMNIRLRNFQKRMKQRIKIRNKQLLIVTQKSIKKLRQVFSVHNQ